MGAKHYVVKLFGCLLVSLLCWTRVQGQVVITETVEVQPSGQTGFQMAEGNVVGPGGYYHPVLHRIGRGTYVVLKTGELKFYFEEAQSYGIEQIEEHVLDYSIVGPSTSISGSADVIDYLGNPILLQEDAEISCNQTQTYFVSELEYAIGPTDDTWILTSFEGTEYGNSNILDARSYNFTPPTHPDQTMSTSYLQFGIGQFNTNANLRDAYFLIAADTLVTNYESEYYIYKVAGPWNEETLSFENRPPTDVSNYLVVTSTDTIPSAGLIYSSDISSFVSGWLYGTFPDHGIRIASASRHVFESKENYFGTIPTIGLRLTLPEEEINPILNFGYVQAGDTLSVEYMGLSDNFRPTFTDNPVHANDRLTFNKHTGCQTNTYMSLLPHIEEDTTRLSHFEFVLNNELNLPADEHAYKDIYIEPNILFDNGIVGLPGRMFFDYYAELHEVSTVSIPEGTPGLPAGMSPVALLDGSPNGWASFRPNKPGTTLQYLSNPLAQGKTFKLVVAGTIRKGILIGKENPNYPNPSDITQAIQDAILETHPDLSVAAANCDLNPYGQEQEGVFVSCFEFTIGSGGIEIMLGESKYFYAVEDPEEPSKLLIKDLETDPNSTEAVILPNDGIADAFSSDNIIEVISGEKSGVYWERKRTLIDDNGTLTVQDLPEGIVRLIGRYWEADKEYSVKLKAASENRSGELEIKVIKPSKLGGDYGLAKDVFDKVIDVDSLIITNAGKYGVPPQVIKAQINVEAAKKDFGGNVGIGFAPSYRYEPYTVQLWNLQSCCANYFFEDSTSANFSDMPAHKHVLFRDYYREVKTVWDIIKENSQLVKNSSPSTYGHRDANGKMNFGKYLTIQRKYNGKYKEVEKNDRLSVTEIADSTNKLFSKYLQNEWEDKNNEIKGAKNMIAQTRVASSYGFLQMLYSTAIHEVNFDNQRPPEKMNENSFFIEFIQYQKDKIDERLSLNNDTDFNWTEGYEFTIRNSVFEIWNSAPGYPEAVLRRIEKFLPLKNN